MKTLLKISLFPALALVLTHCSPVKGYVGPELPDTSLSIITVEYDSNSTEFKNAEINGIEFGTAGIKVLPGEQIFEIEVGFKDRPQGCRAYAELNNYSYNQCLDKKESYKCDCWDFLETHERCYRQIHDNVCRGDMRTGAGGQYEIQVRRSRDSGNLKVVEQGTGRNIGKGSCQFLEDREVEEENYIGTGRYTANSHGIYYCGSTY